MTSSKQPHPPKDEEEAALEQSTNNKADGSGAALKTPSKLNRGQDKKSKGGESSFKGRQNRPKANDKGLGRVAPQMAGGSDDDSSQYSADEESDIINKRAAAVAEASQGSKVDPKSDSKDSGEGKNK